MSSVYFIQKPSTGDIKIGFSTNFRSRYKALCLSMGEECKILGTIDADMKLEKAYHERYAHLRIHGEWFKSSPELLRDINSAVKAGGKRIRKSYKTPHAKLQFELQAALKMAASQHLDIKRLERMLELTQHNEQVLRRRLKDAGLCHSPLYLCDNPSDCEMCKNGT